MGLLRTEPAPSEPQFVIEEVTDPAAIARSQAQFARFQRNSNWLKVHWGDLLPQARGKFLAVAGEKAFLGDTPDEAWRKAKAAHPEDDGAFSQYVLPRLGPRIYPNYRRVVAVR